MTDLQRQKIDSVLIQSDGRTRGADNRTPYFLDNGFDTIQAFKAFFEPEVTDSLTNPIIPDWQAVILNLAETAYGGDLKSNDETIIEKTVRERTTANSDNGLDLSQSEFKEVLAVVENLLTDDVFQHVDGYSERTSPVTIGNITVSPNGKATGYDATKSFPQNFGDKTNIEVFNTLTNGQSTRLEKDYVLNLLSDILGKSLGISNRDIERIITNQTLNNESISQGVFVNIVNGIYNQYHNRFRRESESTYYLLKRLQRHSKNNP